MAFSSRNLLKELDRDEIIDWAIELKHHAEAYAFLNRGLRNGELNLKQTRNALHALFRIGFQDRGAEILETFVEFAKSDDMSVRSEAVQLAIGLVRWLNRWGKVPLVLSGEQTRILRDAVSVGVTPKVSNLAKKFFN
jgi:hypothetical protein